MAEHFSKCGGTNGNPKQYRKILFELTTVASQALKYDVINFCQHVYAMLYKPSTTPDYRRVARNFHRGETTTKYQHLNI